jgi:hypothetical protein
MSEIKAYAAYDGDLLKPYTFERDGNEEKKFEIEMHSGSLSPRYLHRKRALGDQLYIH